MANIKNLVGKKFNKLTVISKTEKRNSIRCIIWICLCECGNLCEVSTNNLRRGGTRSCGCLQKKIASENGKKRNLKGTKLQKGEASFNQLYCYYKKRALGRGLLFELTKEQFKELTSSKCIYCNSEPSYEQKGQNLNGYYIYNGIDRVDNSIGYTVENSVPCCG